MLLLLNLLFFFLFFPLTAWAYFDPGFGGYLVNSIITLIVTGFAFISAAVIYFFRTIIGQRLFLLWQKHKRLCPIALLSLLGLGSAVLGALVFRAFNNSCFFNTLVKTNIVIYLMKRSWIDPGFGELFPWLILSLIVIGIAAVSAMIVYYQKLRTVIFLFVLSLVSACLGASLLHAFYNPPTHYYRLSGARIIDQERMFKGYSLYNGKLIDAQGRIVKQWSNRYLGTIDKSGDYYAQQNWEAPLWGRYTWDDHVIWEKHFRIDHEIYLSPRGTIFTFTWETHRYNNFNVDFDTILEFDKNGRQLQRYSLWDHLKEFQPYHAKFAIDTAFPGPLLGTKRGSYDYFHLNSFFMVPPNPLEGKNPAFRPGNWLISIRHGSMVFILDQDTKKILWHAVGNEIKGSLEGQHAASMLPDGNILLFDNGFNRWGSRILIIDPVTLKIKWEYKNKYFFSESEGFVQALPNGNLLVTESKKGHAFELAPDKKIVWEYYDNTNKEGDIYRMTRYPKKMIDRFLLKGGS